MDPRRIGLVYRSFRVGTDIDKGVYYALVLTVRNPRKISNCKSKTKQRRCPLGMFIHAFHLLYSHRCILTPMVPVLALGGVWYTYRRGASALLVSTDRAILRSLRSWSGRQCRASRLFMPEKWICKTLVISSPISNNGRFGLAMIVEWNWLTM
jgi:hypothetical protein